jgi:TetR/AcrR family transcriptional regulator, mexJK operon transcriptional repressor
LGYVPSVRRSRTAVSSGRTVAALAAAFRRLGERGLLRIDDPQVAAMHFAGMVVMMPLDKTMIGGSFTDQELARFADAGARTLLAAYGTAGSAGA